ncbi:MAG TPA: Uma2 family endonuclease [Gemmataceae bacterium]|nr:Uma2 family endonuclease [Gemmataceae bacterium]
MNLTEFDRAEGAEGYLYELSRGVVVVVDVPNRRHQTQVAALRLQFSAYQLAHPEQIDTLAGSGECKILLPDKETERHPDLAVYKHPPPTTENIWATWIPEIVVEVVSPESEHRDYVEKRQDYLDFGVREYWIIDADKQQMLVLRRRGGRWTERVVRPPEGYQTRLLPGFEFNLAQVFQAAEEARG